MLREWLYRIFRRNKTGPCTLCGKIVGDFPQIKTIDPNGLVGWDYHQKKWFCPDCYVTLVVENRHRETLSFYYSIGAEGFCYSKPLTTERILELSADILGDEKTHTLAGYTERVQEKIDARLKELLKKGKPSHEIDRNLEDYAKKQGWLPD